MEIGGTISDLRKDKGFSREELGKMVGSSGAVIGRYERDEITPSVEIAKKLADALDVSLDYLVGSSSFLIKDKKMVYRLELLQKVAPQEKERILYVFDTLLKEAQNSNMQQQLAK